MQLVLESGAALIENDLYAMPAGPSGQVDMANSVAGGQRRRQKTEARGTRMMRAVTRHFAHGVIHCASWILGGQRS